MGLQPLHHVAAGKKVRGTTRELNTPLYLLRCLDVGLSMADLDEMSIGLVYDLWIEKGNDRLEYDQVATQEDFDRF